MVSPVLNEQWYTGGFLVSEAPGTLSRDNGVLDNTAGALDLYVPAGLVVMAEAFGTLTAAAKPGNTGNGTIGSLSVQPPAGSNPGAMVGAYTISFTSAIAFSVFAPDGRELLPGVVGTAYADEIGFRITAGGTAFAAGDGFTITVPAGSGNLVAFDGTGAVAGIVFNRVYVPAGGTARCTIVTRDAEVNRAELQWGSVAAGSPTIQASAAAQLAAMGVIPR
jgi:hypothetical protein